MRGDILFWTGDRSKPIDRLIMDFTHGPFVHVSIDHGDGWTVGARSDGGVIEQTIPSGLTVYHPSSSTAPLDIEKGMGFLHQQLGRPYGYCNVLNVVLRAFHLPYRIIRLGHYDCSALVAHYLLHIGMDISDEPDSLSPNDLARLLGIIKP